MEELPDWSARSEFVPGTFWQAWFFEKTRTVKGVPEFAVKDAIHAPRAEHSSSPSPCVAKRWRSPNGKL